jgi:hypothetical protein
MVLDVTRSTVKVFGQKEVGTGFVLDQDIIVTCAHVVGKADSQPKIVFSANGEERLNQPLVFYSPEGEYDIAVLRLIGGLPNNVVPLKLGRSIGSIGHPFHTFGFPKLPPFEGLRCEGTINGEVRDKNRRPFLQVTSKQITSGVSGAALLNDKTGRVVGMVVWAAIKEWEHLEEKIRAAIEERKPEVTSTVIPETAFAIPAEMLYRLLHEKFPKLQLHPPEALADYLKQVDDYCNQDPYSIWDIRPSLEEIYVPLQLRYRPPIERKEVAEGSPPEERLQEQIQILPAAEALAKSDKPHLVIVAGPGAGKSTLLRQFAKNAWDDPQRIGLATPHIPVPVPLGKLDTEVSVESGLARALTTELSLEHDLPSGFWDDWPAQTEARWLILLDALDEVPSARKQKVMERLRALLRMSAGSRIVITSRPSGYTYGELDQKVFKHYELEPFGPDQRKTFSRKWLGDGAESFLVKYDRLEAGDLKNTPLLLTLAARVYKEKQLLPTQRSELYKELVDRSLERAIDHGLNTELGEKLAGGPTLHADRLSYLAQCITASGQTLDEASVEGYMTDYFQKNEGVLKAFAKDHAEQWPRIIGRCSGLLIGKQGSYEFLHPTVREYLAAKYLLENEGLQQMLKHYWHQPRYEGVLAFALSTRAAESGGGADVIDALTWLVSYGTDTYQRNPQELFAIGCSPLRTALHLVRSAGLVLKDLATLAECLRTEILVSELRQHAVACDNLIPGEVLKWLSKVETEDVRGSVAANPNTPQEILERLAENGSEEVRILVAWNPSTPSEVLKCQAEDSNEAVRAAVANSPSTPPEVLERLAEDSSEWVRTRVSTNPSTPLEVRMRLSEEGADGLRERIAEHGSAPPEVLKRLAEDGSEEVRVRVAWNRSAPPEVLKCLAEDGSEVVRKYATLNASTPPEVLERLAEDNSEWVRTRVAANPSASPEVLKRLAEDGSGEVRKLAALNSNTPPEVLKRLAEDSDKEVRQRLAKNPNTPPEVLKRLAEDSAEEVRVDLADSPKTPPEILKRLAEDASEGVRAAVAGNSNTPLEVLNRLAEDGSEEVRVPLAFNPSAPPEVLKIFAEDGGEDMRRLVANNPSAPPEVLKILAEHSSEKVQQRLANNPNTPPEVLKRLAEGGSEEVRRWVTLNSSTPPEVLKRLAGGGGDDMRRLVARNPNVILEAL